MVSKNAMPVFSAFDSIFFCMKCSKVRFLSIQHEDGENAVENPVLHEVCGMFTSLIPL